MKSTIFKTATHMKLARLVILAELAALGIIIWASAVLA